MSFHFQRARTDHTIVTLQTSRAASNYTSL